MRLLWGELRDSDAILADVSDGRLDFRRAETAAGAAI